MVLKKWSNYDALVIPGGVINPAKMRINKDCVEFMQQFLEAGKPVPTIGHRHNGLVTSRSPRDLEAFNKKMIEEIGEGKHSPVAYTPTPSH